MIVGVLKEIKPAEKRVCMTPAGVDVMIKNGHKVYWFFIFLFIYENKYTKKYFFFNIIWVLVNPPFFFDELLEMCFGRGLSHNSFWLYAPGGPRLWRWFRRFSCPGKSPPQSRQQDLCCAPKRAWKKELELNLVLSQWHWGQSLMQTIHNYTPYKE